MHIRRKGGNITSYCQPSYANTDLTPDVIKHFGNSPGTNSAKNGEIYGAIFQILRYDEEGDRRALNIDFVNLTTGGLVSPGKVILVSPYMWNNLSGGNNLSTWIGARFVKVEEPINVAGNVNGGNGLNVTSKLGVATGQGLYPAFRGGTLTVDQANPTVTQDFTLDGSSTNAIDANGNSAIFSGIISDAATGAAGGITFTDSKPGSQVITLTTANDYSGTTNINNVALIVTGALSDQTSVIVASNGT